MKRLIKSSWIATHNKMDIYVDDLYYVYFGKNGTNKREFYCIEDAIEAIDNFKDGYEAIDDIDKTIEVIEPKKNFIMRSNGRNNFYLFKDNRCVLSVQIIHNYFC